MINWLSRLMLRPVELVIVLTLLAVLLYKAVKKVFMPMTADSLKMIVDHTQKWEGGLSRNMNDSASSLFCPTPHSDGKKYHTNKGVTYKTWKGIFGTANDKRFLNMSDKDWFKCYSKYWDGMQASKVKDWRIGALMAQFAWGSGVYGGSRLVQKILKKKAPEIMVDGRIGTPTINEINSRNPKKLFDELIQGRKEFFQDLAESSSKMATFLNGWLNRLNDFNKTFRHG